MMQKVLMCVAFLALCYTCMSTPTQCNCEEDAFDNEASELDSEGNGVFRDKDGKVIQRQVYQNASLVVLKFPDREGCFVLRKDGLPSTDGMTYLKFEKMEDVVKADPNVAADIAEKVEECKTTPVFEMKEVTEEDDDSGSPFGKAPTRRKRACTFRYRVVYRCRFIYFFRYRRYFFFCRWIRYRYFSCSGK